MHAVYELATVRPHEPDDARYTAAEYLCYRQGYEHALVIVLKVLKVTVERWYLRKRFAREKPAAKKTRREVA